MYDKPTDSVSRCRSNFPVCYNAHAHVDVPRSMPTPVRKRDQRPLVPVYEGQPYLQKVPRYRKNSRMKYFNISALGHLFYRKTF
ncbi:hypothetical protein BDV40DRAFT_91939 [Aspergillus tamarii]|uniref:Uncharacterized protein n=1 Tax=Aspergillus tamarii TaxID=41984 RepID=A0A5N6UBX7_ASPTM|nr:hypothetical protein BDV40DRAFT_91939 [Aspergillus tamarii]